MSGYRNFGLGILYLAVCVYFAHLSPSDSIKDLGPTFISLGAGVTGVVGMRALNKWAENGVPKP